MQHDACGVGFVARLCGEAGHDIVGHGLTALVRLAHRGAPASLGAVDGCGLVTDIPWALVEDSRGGRVPSGAARALVMFLVTPQDRSAPIAIVERALEAAGASVSWRSVPIH